MISFEEFLQEKFIEDFPGTKDQAEVAEEHWFENLDVSELIEYGDQYAGKSFQEGYLEGQKKGIEMGSDLSIKVMNDLRNQK